MLKVKEKIIIREDVIAGISAMIEAYQNVSFVSLIIYSNKKHCSEDGIHLGVKVHYKEKREKEATRCLNLVNIPQSVMEQFILPEKTNESGFSGSINEKVAQNILSLIGLKMADELKELGHKVNKKELIYHKRRSWREIVGFNKTSPRKIDIPNAFSCQLILAYNFA